MVSKKTLTIVGILLIFATLPISLILIQNNTDSRQHAAEADTITCDTASSPENSTTATMSAQQLKDQLRSDTQTLKKQITEYRLSLSEKRTALRKQLKAQAQTRKEKLLTLMRQDPQNALNFIQQNPPDQEIKSLTANCTEQIESVAGALNISHADYANAHSNTFYSVKTPTKEVALHFVRPTEISLIPHAQVTAQGYALGNDILVPTSSTDSFSTQSVANDVANNAAQSKNVAVVAMNLSDRSGGPDLSTISNTVFSTVSNYYHIASLGKVGLSGSAHGWYQSNLSAYDCNMNDYANSAMNVARSQFNFTNVDILVVVAPFGCGWTGQGSIGYRTMSTPNGTKDMGIALISSFNQGTVEHEIGHTFNIWHAGYANCTCNNVEYGDPYDVMGQSDNSGILNAAHKAAIGWLDSSTMPTVTSTAVYTLLSDVSLGSGLKALRIPRANHSTLYVYYRSGHGLVINAAAVTKYPYPDGGVGESDTSLIDASPATSDIALAVGTTFSDTNSNISIKSISYGTNTVSVRVTIPGTIASTPTPTPHPTATPTPKPTPTPTPRPTATPIPKPTATPTLKPSPTPTSKPTAMPTPKPSPTATPTPLPTLVPTAKPPTPTPTFSPTATVVSLIVYLHGIGNGGDNANPSSKGNLTPIRLNRTGALTIYDANNKQVLQKNVNLTYNSSGGYFTGSLDIGNNLTNSSYILKVKTPSYLSKRIPGIYTITSGQPIKAQAVSLTAGDIREDNAITISDYDVLLGCYSDFLPAISCTPADKLASDLNDDGSVNQYDYNLLLREWTQSSGD